MSTNYTDTRSDACTHTRARRYTHTHAHAHTRTHTHTQTHTHARTHTRTHTHTHVCHMSMQLPECIRVIYMSIRITQPSWYMDTHVWRLNIPSIHVIVQTECIQQLGLCRSVYVLLPVTYYDILMLMSPGVWFQTYIRPKKKVCVYGFMPISSQGRSVGILFYFSE
jgi:hypothetical protein